MTVVSPGACSSTMGGLPLRFKLVKAKVQSAGAGISRIPGLPRSIVLVVCSALPVDCALAANVPNRTSSNTNCLMLERFRKVNAAASAKSKAIDFRGSSQSRASPLVVRGPTSLRGARRGGIIFGDRLPRTVPVPAFFCAAAIFRPAAARKKIHRDIKGLGRELAKLAKHASRWGWGCDLIAVMKSLISSRDEPPSSDFGAPRKVASRSCTGTVRELACRDHRSRGTGACATKRRQLIRKSSGSESDQIRLNPTFSFFYFFREGVFNHGLTQMNTDFLTADRRSRGTGSAESAENRKGRVAAGVKTRVRRAAILSNYE